MKALKPRMVLLAASSVFRASSFSVRHTHIQRDFRLLHYNRFGFRPNERIWKLYSTTSNEENEEVRARTLGWIKRVVVGMNLCPFAEKPTKQQRLKIDVVRGDNEEKILQHILSEMFDRCHIPGTTLVVTPDLYPDDFASYMEVVSLIEDGLMAEYEEKLAGNVQVAPFHPDFQFGGSEPTDVDNWTNKSPYPIFHILREEEVSRAVDLLGGDAGKVWRRNIELLETMRDEMGIEDVEQIMTGEASEGSGPVEKCHRILRRFRVKLGSGGSDS